MCGFYVLREDDRAVIHGQALRVLEQVGIVIHHGELLSLLRQAGAHIDGNRDLVQIPQLLVEQCLNQVPRSVEVAGLTCDRNVHLALDGGQYFRPIGGPEWILDHGATEYRYSSCQDVVNWLRVVEVLPNLISRRVSTSFSPVVQRLWPAPTGWVVVGRWGCKVQAAWSSW